ncbi:MAG TPA: hypothetical protein VF607_10980 [Verrucomicrobiae bacterium]
MASSLIQKNIPYDFISCQRLGLFSGPTKIDPPGTPVFKTWSDDSFLIFVQGRDISNYYLLPLDAAGQPTGFD